jgi:hypothetical protein
MSLKRKSYKLDGQAIRTLLGTSDEFLGRVERGLVEDKLSWLGWVIIGLAGLVLVGQMIRAAMM